MKNRCRIEFDGLNVGRTLNFLNNRGIVVRNVRRNGKNCSVEVDFSDYKQVVAILKEKCYNIKEVRFLGVSAVVKWAFRHVVAVIAALLVLPLLALSSGFCWKIQVSGDYSEQEILSSLGNCGVTVGSSLFNFDADFVENAVATDLDAMYVVVNRRGSALYVNAVKPQKAEEPVEMHSRRDIVALCGGVVTSIAVLQGTAAVAVGDRVEKGQVLVKGERQFNDGTFNEVYAMGKVTLQVSVSALAQYTGFAEVLTETGRTFTRNAIRIAEIQTAYGQVPFEHFRLEEQTTALSPLNVAVVKQTYHEQVLQSVPQSLQQCLPQLKEKAYQDALSMADFAVTNAEYSINSQGVTVTLYGQITMD